MWLVMACVVVPAARQPSDREVGCSERLFGGRWVRDVWLCNRATSDEG